MSEGNMSSVLFSMHHPQMFFTKTEIFILRKATMSFPYGICWIIIYPVCTGYIYGYDDVNYDALIANIFAWHMEPT